MKLVMTLLVSDETDLFETNLRYHFARGVDLMVVTANRAPEAVLGTLEGYVAQGLVYLIEEHSDTYSQSQWVTRMARLAATEFQADWVINGDADEFYWPQSGSFKEVFAVVPEEYGVLNIPVSHFPPRPGQADSFIESMNVRELRSYKPDGWRYFQKVAHRASADVVVGRGNHKVEGAHLRLVPGWEPIQGLHFPLRSYEQFERKTVRDGLAAEKNRALPDEPRTLYSEYQAGRLPAHYSARVLDDEAAEAAIREGRLVVDERLRDFVQAGHLDARPATPSEQQIAKLKIEVAQAIYQAPRDPLRLTVDRLEAKLERQARKRESERERAERRLANAKQHSDKLASEIAALERDRIQRLRRRLAGVGRALGRSRWTSWVVGVRRRTL